MEKIDFVGYFLPWETDFEAGPNARQFLIELSEHLDVSHVYTKEIFYSATNIREIETILTGLLSLIQKPTLSLNIDKRNNQCTLQNNVKAKQKSIQQRIMDDYNTKVNLIRYCKNKIGKFAEGNIFSVILSNAGQLQANLKSLNQFQKCSEQLTGNGIFLPLEVILTKNNISRAQVALLD